jgi:hypothetical protein
VGDGKTMTAATDTDAVIARFRDTWPVTGVRPSLIVVRHPLGEQAESSRRRDEKVAREHERAWFRRNVLHA